MVAHGAVLDCSNFIASRCRHGKMFTLTPRSRIKTDLGEKVYILPCLQRDTMKFEESSTAL